MTGLLLALLAAIAPIRDLSGSATASATVATYPTFALTIPDMAAVAVDSCAPGVTHSTVTEVRLLRHAQSGTWVTWHERMLADPFVWALMWPRVRAEAAVETVTVRPVYPEERGTRVTIASPDTLHGYWSAIARSVAGYSCYGNEVWK